MNIPSKGVHALMCEEGGGGGDGDGGGGGGAGESNKIFG